MVHHGKRNKKTIRPTMGHDANSFTSVTKATRVSRKKKRHSIAQVEPIPNRLIHTTIRPAKKSSISVIESTNDDQHSGFSKIPLNHVKLNRLAPSSNNSRQTVPTKQSRWTIHVVDTARPEFLPIQRRDINKWNDDQNQSHVQLQSQGFSLKHMGETKTFPSKDHMRLSSPTNEKSLKVFSTADDQIETSVSTANRNSILTTEDYAPEPYFWDGHRRNTHRIQKHRKSSFYPFACSPLCAVLTAILSFVLLGIILAIILVALLVKVPKSTTAVTTSITAVTTTSTLVASTNSCSLSPGGVVYGSLVAANTSDNWTSISISFNASLANSTLALNIEATNQYAWFLDDFSIIDTAGNETLLNGDFESGSFADWISYPCTSSTCASLVNSNCTVGSIFCYKISCTSIEVLTQTFPTLPGDTYTLSFQVKYFLQNSGNPANNNKILYRIT